MEGLPFSVPNWWGRYNTQQGRGMSTLDQSTLAYLSQHFGCLPILLLPVDYSLPLAMGTLTLVVPPPPLPQTRAHEVPQAAAVSLEDLQGLMGEAAAEQEGELAELSQWYARLEPAEKRTALASVAKSLNFHDAAATTAAPASQHLSAPGPALNVFADSAPSSLAAEPGTAAAAATARPLPLGDRTNAKASMKQLSSKLHVAASKKVAAQLPVEEAKELLAYQLSAAAQKEATFAPWHRPSASHGGKAGAKTVAGTSFLRC